MTKPARSFCRDESGTTAMEYGLIAILIAVVIVGALQAIGGSLTDIFTDVEAGFKKGTA